MVVTRGAEREIDAGPLFQSANHQTELRVSEKAGEGPDCRHCVVADTIPQARGQKVVCSGRRNGIYDGRSRENAIWVCARRGSCKGRSGAALEAHASISDEGVSEEPIEAKGFGIFLRHLSELGVDHDLRRRLVQHLHCLLDDVEVLKRGANHELAEAVVPENCFRRGKVDASGEEELTHDIDVVRMGVSAVRWRMPGLTHCGNGGTSGPAAPPPPLPAPAGGPAAAARD